MVCSCTFSHFSKVERTSSSPFSTNHHLITIPVPIYWLELTFALYFLNAHRCQFVRVVMTTEAEVSLMVPQTFLAPSIGTLGLKRTMLGRTVLGSRCLRALRLVDHSFVSLIMHDEIINNHSCIPKSIFQLHPHPSPRSSNSRQLYVPFASTNAYKYLFFIDIVSYWTSLPQDIINSPSPNSFKTCLFRHFFC